MSSTDDFARKHLFEWLTFTGLCGIAVIIPFVRWMSATSLEVMMLGGCVALVAVAFEKARLGMTA